MTIVSISLTDQNLVDLDNIQGQLGLTGRSEAIRAAIRSLMTEMKDRKEMKGRVDGVLIAINRSSCSENIHEVYHENHHLITTHVHNHLGGNKCMNVMVIGGEADQVVKVLEMFERLEGIAYLTFIRS
jgi:CopG family nickel-responsive transcriptional regulator